MRRNKLLLICLASGLSVNLVRAEQQIQDADAILGLWGSWLIVEPDVHGPVTIDARGSKWLAAVSGWKMPVQRNNENVTFRLPYGIGEFRGQLVDAKSINGHWIQRANSINNNRYATPIELSSNSDKVWRGNVEPLRTNVSVYMSIRRAQDGLVTAVIQNPEFNQFRRNVYRVDIRRDPVDVRGDAVTFSDVKNPDDEFWGRFDRKADRLTVGLPPDWPEFHFTRKPEDVRNCFPRTPRDQNYACQKPVAGDDGWSTASVSDVALDAKPVSALIDKILHVDPLNNPFPIHSLLIARHGKLVLEEYFYGFNKERPHDMRSASKTFAPLLVGIARDRGAKIDIDTPVYSQFSEYKEFANPDPRKLKMTVHDLMTMTSGLACDDNDDSSPGNEDKMQQQKEQPDWYKYMLDLPMARDPGGDQAVYCSAGINLLGGIVRNKAHKWLPEFFYDNVAKPLQMKTYHWNLMPNGDGYAGGGIYMRPRDQLKLGQLYLDGGVWNGQRVVSKDWVERSTSRQSSFGPTLGADHDYGYGWHLYHFEVGGRSYRAYAAGGNGGQIVIVIPDLDLVIGFTGGAYGEFAKWYKWQLELVPQFMIPAATTKRSE